MTCQGFRGLMCCFFELYNSVSHRYGEADAAHDGKIRKIIAHVGDNRIDTAAFRAIRNPSFGPSPPTKSSIPLPAFVNEPQTQDIRSPRY